MPLEFNTVAVPVTGGVNLTTPARLLPPGQLLEATNSRFPRGAGATKRRGHSATRVRSLLPIPPATPISDLTPPTQPAAYSDYSLPGNWVWGWGLRYSSEALTLTAALAKSAYPAAGLLFGSAQRDNETVLWDGFKLYSRAAGQTTGALPTTDAVMPALRSVPVAKSNQAQAFPQVADTGRIKVSAWINGTDVWYCVQDSTTLAMLLAPTAYGLSAAGRFRVLCVDNWVHIVAWDTDLLLHRKSIHADSPTVAVSASLGACASPGYFDVSKSTRAEWLLVRNTTGTELIVTWHGIDGTQLSSKPAVVPVVSAGAITSLAIYNVSICATGGYTSVPLNDDFGLAWKAQVTAGPTYAVIGGVYSRLGGLVGNLSNLGAISVADTVSPISLAGTQVNSRVFNCWFDWTNSGTPSIRINRYSSTASLYSADRFSVGLYSTAFRCGSRSFAWVGYSSSLQSTLFLLDELLKPIGKAEYVTANVSTSTSRPLSQVNWRAGNGLPTTFHGGLGYRIRVPVDIPNIGANVPAVYADPSFKFWELDFLPQLRAAQANRSLYFAGAQLWSYDGLELTEGGFHLAPEPPTGTPSGSGSGLSAGDYRWRVDVCYRNAHNEEHRSASFYTSAVTVTAGQNVALTIKPVITRRDSAYLLIFRNQANGTQWYLVNSRDPASAQFVRNDQSAATITYTDTGAVTDAALASRELHPANSAPNYLDQYSAPACEVLGAGHGRLWVAGGELPAGQIYPSRLFLPNETPGFNAYLQLEVDRGAEPITAIGFVGETRAFFRRTQTYVHQGAGIDNTLNGGWEPIRLAYADVGAVSASSLGLTSAGLLFQSPAGIRMLSAGGGLQPVGQPTDLVARGYNIKSTLVSGDDQEIRFYHTTGVLVYNYLYNLWSTWTPQCAGVTRNVDTGRALIATGDGYLWEEEDGLWTDNGRPYKHRVRFAWLRAGDVMDFQRVRRVGAVGECDPGVAHHIHVDIYYDEREFAEEWFDWTYPDPGSQNTDTFGSAYFGAGTFGDTTGER